MTSVSDPWGKGMWDKAGVSEGSELRSAGDPGQPAKDLKGGMHEDIVGGNQYIASLSQPSYLCLC